MDATAPLLSDHFRLVPRYVRSINIARDIGDGHALDGYVLSDGPRRAAATILNGLRKGSTQRAFRITGPYGAGKSALGLLIARILGSLHEEPPEGLMQEIAPMLSMPDDVSDCFLPLIVTGRRTTLSRALSEAIVDAAELRTARGRKPEVVRLAEDILASPPDAADESRRSVELFDLYCGYVERRNKRVLLIIDELGRFVEYAALAPNRVDPAAFQQIAERCSGKGNHACIALVHSGSGRIDFTGSDIDDWWKVAERFEDIPLLGSTEQSLTLLSRALVNGTPASSEVIEAERQVRHEAASRRLLPSDSEDLSFFPVHPVVLHVLSVASRKIRQNERSFFGFLQSREPFGLQEFLVSHPYSLESWYRLPDLADYLLAGAESEFGDSVRRQRWELMRASIDGRSDLKERHKDILKIVGVINVLEPLPLLRADEDTISFALGVGTVADEIDHLVSEGKLIKRPDKTFALWDSSMVDLSSLRETIEDTLSETAFDVALGFASNAIRPIVAHRHYHETGTLRFFSVVFSKSDLAIDSVKLALDKSDGVVLTVTLGPKDSFERVAKKVVSRADLHDPRVVILLRRLSERHLRAAKELLIWSHALKSSRELQLDDLAREEVQRRQNAAANLLERWFSSQFEVEDTEPGRWIYQGESLALPDRLEFQKLLSNAADKTFPAAPVLKSELINRSQASTAIAAARNRLVRHIFQDHAKERLGMEKTPPEYAIYQAMFRASNLHRMEKGQWRFLPPTKKDPRRWQQAWDRVAEMLKQGTPVKIVKFLVSLAVPPYGLRRDVSLLFLMAYLKAQEQDTILLDNGLLVLRPSDAVFMRLVKTPDSFALHQPRKMEGTTVAVIQASSALVGQRSSGQASVTDAARALYRWYNALPPYAQKTSTVSEKAKSVRTAIDRASDPVELFSTELPKAVSCQEADQPTEVVSALTDAYAELDQAQEKLIDQIYSETEAAFGEIGSIGKIRAFLCEMLSISGDLEDYRPKTVIERAARKDLNDRQWVVLVANTLTSIDPANWTDRQPKTFASEIRHMAVRLMELHALSRRYNGGAGPSDYLSIVTIDLTGKEQAFTFPQPNGQQSRNATEKLMEVRKLLSEDDEEKAILTQLLVDYMRRNPGHGGDGK